MTYNNNGSTFFAECYYFQLNHGNSNISFDGFLKLPNNASELNDYMCGPMKRRGLVCSKCMNGYRPSCNVLNVKVYGVVSYSMFSGVCANHTYLHCDT